MQQQLQMKVRGSSIQLIRNCHSPVPSVRSRNTDRGPSFSSRGSLSRFRSDRWIVTKRPRLSGFATILTSGPRNVSDFPCLRLCLQYSAVSLLLNAVVGILYRRARSVMGFCGDVLPCIHFPPWSSSIPHCNSSDVQALPPTRFLASSTTTFKLSLLFTPPETSLSSSNLRAAPMPAAPAPRTRTSQYSSSILISVDDDGTAGGAR